MSQSEIVRRASASHPCVICGADDKCSQLLDGAYLCRGEPAEPDAWFMLKDSGHAEFKLYRPVGERATRNGKRKSKPTPSPAQPPHGANGHAPATPAPVEINWVEKAEYFADEAHFPARVREALAEQLGVPVEALSKIPNVGANGSASGIITATFPECDATGTVIGITERNAEHTPKHNFQRGGKRGLSLGRDEFNDARTLFVVEGATDTLAMLGAGLRAIGRPGAEGKVGLLAECCIKFSCQIIIVGENDAKPNGSTPGRDGAIKVARHLSEALGREVKWTLPPVGAKDVRDWLRTNTSSRDHAEWQVTGAQLGSMLIGAANPVPDETPSPAQPPAGDEPTDGLPDDPARWDCTPENSHRIAVSFLATLSKPDEPLKLRYWRSEFYTWEGGAYRKIEMSDLRSRLITHIEGDAVFVYSLELAAWNRKSSDGRGPKPKKRNTTTALVRNVMQAFEGLTWLDSYTEAPSWINGSTGPDPKHLVVCANGIVNTKTGELLTPTPNYFTFAATAFGYDPKAKDMKSWDKFLHDIWSQTPDQIESLQEWFGYLLTSDTSQQKMLFLLGPPRAGKGTIGHVIEQIVGEKNSISPKLSDLMGNFGLAPLLNKTVGIISDLRLSDSHNVESIVENLLSITGEDTFTVDRKFLSVITAKLPTRMVVMSNELPRLGDTSGAIYTRMILLRLTKSFLGKEDHELMDRLLKELPAIFNWAVVGLKRLRSRGRFIQPHAGVSLVQQMRDVGSPVGAFVRECCVVESDGKVIISELYDKWKSWCKDNGKKEPGSVQVFGRNLMSSVSDLTVRKLGGHNSTDRRKYYFGIRVRDLFEEGFQEESDFASSVRPETVPDCESYEDAKNDYEKQDNTTLFSIASPASPIKENSPPNACPRPHTPTHTHTHIHEPPPQEFGDAGDANSYQNENPTNTNTASENLRPLHMGRNGDTSRDATPDDQDLYATLKLDFFDLPRGCGTEVLVIAGVIHYLVTPSIMVYFESFAERVEFGDLSNERTAYLNDMSRIWAYVSARYALAEIAQARQIGPIHLPEALEVI